MVSRKKGFIILLICIILVSACSSKPINEEGLGEKIPELTIYTTTPEYDQVRYETARIIADNWKELGLDVKVQPMEYNSLLEKIEGSAGGHDFDAFIFGWAGRAERIDPDIFLYSSLHSSNIAPGNNNMVGFVNEAYDQLAEQQRQTMDLEERRKIVFEAQEMLAEEVPEIVLYYRDEIQGYNHEKFDNFPIMPGEGIFNEWTPMVVKPLTADKTLKVAATVDLATLNPLSASASWEWKMLRLIYDKLVRINPQSEPEPWAAERWENVDDTTVDVILRSDLQFHDGEPLTVEDIKFTFDYMMEWGVPYLQAFLNPIESVEIMDESTVRFNLIEPYGPFIINTLGQIPILPQHFWADLVDREGLQHPGEYANLEPLGSGPFVFNYWRRGEEIKLDANKAYFKAPEIDAMIYRLYGHADGVYGAMEKKEMDMNAWRFEPLHVEKARQMEHITVTEAPDIGFYFLGLNNRQAPFDSKTFRKAIAHSIDYDIIIDSLMFGYAKPGGAGKVISPANNYWYNPDVREYTFDLDLSRQILEEAGYTWNSQGKLHFPKR